MAALFTRLVFPGLVSRRARCWLLKRPSSWQTDRLSVGCRRKSTASDNWQGIRRGERVQGEREVERKLEIFSLLLPFVSIIPAGRTTGRKQPQTYGYVW